MYSPDLNKESSVLTSQLKAMLDNVPFPAWFKDREGRYLAVNQKKEEAAGYKEKDMKGKTDYELFDKAFADLMSIRDLESVTLKRQTLYEDHCKNGYWEELFIRPVFDESGAVIGTTGLCRDITDRKKSEVEIDYLRHTDVLTGLRNRLSFESALLEHDRPSGLPLSIIMVDVNGLKLTNDMFGNHEGDRLLKQIADILIRFARKDDVTARIGGDEFCIVLPKTTQQTARKISNQILKVCEEFEGEGVKEAIYPSISIGYATKNELDETMINVMAEAEELMYKRKILERKSVHSSVVASIKMTLFEKSHETEEHAERLVELSKRVGLEMGLDDRYLNELNLLASLHDIGKMGVHDHILSKPGKLTESEWAEIRRHPEVGYRIAQSSPELSDIANYILCHHERWDGKGYPQGLNKRNIPLLSRILAVVDAYDAITQDRVYRKAAPEDLAILEIIKHSGSQFDPDVAIVFIKTIKDKLS